MTTQIFRVTVRGRFAGLTDAQRADLLARAGEHEALVAARFTPDGSLVYDRSLDFFSFRIEIREQSEDGADRTAEAFARAQALLVARLDGWGLGHRDLRVTGTDMATMWR